MSNVENLIWPPAPPVDAWGALFEHLDAEVLAGRESFQSHRRLFEWACAADSRSAYPDAEKVIKGRALDTLKQIAVSIIRQAIPGALAEIEKNKAPFWAKKWRGQR